MSDKERTSPYNIKKKSDGNKAEYNLGTFHPLTPRSD